MSTGSLSTFPAKKSESPTKHAQSVKTQKSSNSQSDQASLLTVLTSMNPENNKLLQTLVVALQAQTLSSSNFKISKVSHDSQQLGPKS